MWLDASTSYGTPETTLPGLALRKCSPPHPGRDHTGSGPTSGACSTVWVYFPATSPGQVGTGHPFSPCPNSALLLEDPPLPFWIRPLSGTPAPSRTEWTILGLELPSLHLPLAPPPCAPVQHLLIFPPHLSLEILSSSRTQALLGLEP